MYTGTLIEGLLDIAERVSTAAKVGQPQNVAGHHGLNRQSGSSAAERVYSPKSSRSRLV